MLLSPNLWTVVFLACLGGCVANGDTPDIPQLESGDKGLGVEPGAEFRFQCDLVECEYQIHLDSAAELTVFETDESTPLPPALPELSRNYEGFRIRLARGWYNAIVKAGAQHRGPVNVRLELVLPGGSAESPGETFATNVEPRDGFMSSTRESPNPQVGLRDYYTHRWFLPVAPQFEYAEVRVIGVEVFSEEVAAYVRCEADGVTLRQEVRAVLRDEHHGEFALGCDNRSENDLLFLEVSSPWGAQLEVEFK